MFRSGQWVKFAAEPGARLLLLGERKIAELSTEELATVCRGCAHAEDGKLVGIYQTAGRDPATGKQTPAHVACVKPDTGLNLRFLHEGAAVLVAFDPSSLSGLEAVTSRADVPSERLASAPEGWTPRA